MDKKKQRKEQMDDAIERATKRAEVQELQIELAKVKVEHEDIRNQLKRAVADYQNLERRISEGRSEMASYVGAELIRKILPVLDHLEQAMSGVSGSVDQSVSETAPQSGWVKGVELAIKELNQVLASEGLEQIATEGQFDPNLHEAVDTQEGENNMILKVVKKGYIMNNKVLRPAQVVVGRSESENMKQESREEN